MRMLGTMLLAVGIAVVLVVLLADFPDLVRGRRGRGARDRARAAHQRGSSRRPEGIAALAAALTASAPWLSRRWRRWGWVAVGGLVMTRFLTSPASFDSAEAVLAGWFAGAAVLVALGAPSRRPTADAIREGLERGGLPLQSLDPASVDARGSTPVLRCRARRHPLLREGARRRPAQRRPACSGSTGRSSATTSATSGPSPRCGEPWSTRPSSRWPPATSASPPRGCAPWPYAEPNAFVLAYEAVDGKSLDGVPPEQITDDVLADIWQQLGRMRALRIAHRDLRLANLFLGSDGKIWMIDFGFSEVAASDLLLANDVAELVASSSAVVGAERATAHAMASVDAATLAAARDRLQPWALSGASRTALKERPGLLDDLRARLAPCVSIAGLASAAAGRR